MGMLVRELVMGQVIRLSNSLGQVFLVQDPTMVLFQVCPSIQALLGAPEYPFAQIPLATEFPTVVGHVIASRVWPGQEGGMQGLAGASHVPFPQ
jgi:hypothetical protein